MPYSESRTAISSESIINLSQSNKRLAPISVKEGKGREEKGRGEKRRRKRRRNCQNGLVYFFPNNISDALSLVFLYFLYELIESVHLS